MTDSTSPKQHLLAALKIRELILRGQLPAGERVTEAALAERLGLSRTPVRQALPALAQEGLLVPVGKRGYAVRVFTAAETHMALEIRATLEGMAARIVAEQGLSPELLEEFQKCLDEGDEILSRDGLGQEEEQAYGEMNQRFHELILRAAQKPLLNELVARCLVVPFVSPLMVAFGDPDITLIREDLTYAHRQHHYIVEALRNREATRVEMLLREHAATQRHSMSL
ncbi:MAG: GntR family transcriptional regulator [Pseudomonas sp.]|uniref:GntR family transcriptional regulator n=1 Tax=Pseudomonas sp. TaxID=306 RepID=UPI0039829B04